jgi:hypothetical protein
MTASAEDFTGRNARVSFVRARTKMREKEASGTSTRSSSGSPRLLGGIENLRHGAAADDDGEQLKNVVDGGLLVVPAGLAITVALTASPQVIELETTSATAAPATMSACCSNMIGIVALRRASRRPCGMNAAHAGKGHVR